MTGHKEFPRIGCRSAAAPTTARRRHSALAPPAYNKPVCMTVNVLSMPSSRPFTASICALRLSSRSFRGFSFSSRAPFNAPTTALAIAVTSASGTVRFKLSVIGVARLGYPLSHSLNPTINATLNVMNPTMNSQSGIRFMIRANRSGLFSAPITQCPSVSEPYRACRQDHRAIRKSDL